MGQKDLKVNWQNGILNKQDDIFKLSNTLGT
jgi:hypothetical protein